jgi:hypothetical protein
MILNGKSEAVYQKRYPNEKSEAVFRKRYPNEKSEVVYRKRIDNTIVKKYPMGNQRPYIEKG